MRCYSEYENMDKRLAVGIQPENFYWVSLSYFVKCPARTEFNFRFWLLKFLRTLLPTMLWKCTVLSAQ